MKANRAFRDPSPGIRFRDDESAVSEAIGYIITFGVSTIVLVASLSAFSTIRDYTTDLAIDRALDEVGAQVSFAIGEAKRAGANYPGSDYDFTVTLPRDIDGVGYELYITDRDKLVLEADSLATPDSKGALGTVVIDILSRAGVETLCPTRDTVLGDGRCWAVSGSGELVVTYGTTTDENGAAVTGVYFRTDS
ncbi:MAG: hypothetical protein KY455_05920 [Euryarchaeota archaeon]|nr:hypothetical protein [Euryarchaeota archaeon]